jgi:hypothetical protein
MRALCTKCHIEVHQSPASGASMLIIIRMI